MMSDEDCLRCPHCGCPDLLATGRPRDHWAGRARARLVCDACGLCFTAALPDGYIPATPRSEPAVTLPPFSTR